MDNSYVLDSYALLAHFEDETGGEQVRKLLRAAQTARSRLFLSVINLGELYYSTLRERGPEQAEEVWFMTQQLPITIVDADKDLTREAAKLKGAYSIAYADCFAAALSMRKGAKVVTGDPEFKKFSKDVSVEWIK